MAVHVDQTRHQRGALARDHERARRRRARPGRRDRGDPPVRDEHVARDSRARPSPRRARRCPRSRPRSGGGELRASAARAAGPAQAASSQRRDRREACATSAMPPSGGSSGAARRNALPRPCCRIDRRGTVVSDDMRAPAFGAPARELYAAALDQVQWADALGFDCVGLGEHHGSPTATTRRRSFSRARWARARSGSGSAPRWCSRRSTTRSSSPRTRPSPSSPRTGAWLLGIGGGYRPSEFETFGRKLEDRWRAVGETIELLRMAWTGEPFEWQGRRCWVMPRPDPAPPILLGGGSAAAARRAARIADGWFPPLEPSSGRPTETSARSSASRPRRVPEPGPDLSLGVEAARQGLGPPDAARAPPAALVQRVDDRGLRAPIRPVCQTDDTRDRPREPRLSRAHARADARARRSSSARTACST